MSLNGLVVRKMLRLKLNEEGAVEIQKIGKSKSARKQKDSITSVSADKEALEKLAKLSSCNSIPDKFLNAIMDKIMELYMEFAEDEEARTKIDERRLQSMKAFTEEG